MTVARVWLVVLYWWDGSMHVSQTSFPNHIRCFEAGMTVQEAARKMDKARIANWYCETRKGDRQ